MARSAHNIIAKIESEFIKKDLPEFRVGDTVQVHSRIIEGSKERVQVFEGVVIRRSKGSQGRATFTVRKVSYDIGVEKTFLLHSPRIEQIKVMSHGQVRRARLYFLRELRGRASKIKKRSRAVDQTAGAAAEA